MKKYLPLTAAEAAETLFSEQSATEDKRTCLACLGVDLPAALLFARLPEQAREQADRLAEQALPEFRIATHAGPDGVWLLMSAFGQTQEETAELCEALHADIAAELATDARFGYAHLTDVSELASAMAGTARAAELAERFCPGVYAVTYEQVFSHELTGTLRLGKSGDPLVEKKRAAVRALDAELAKTAAAFLQCDLNISLAARKLYLHRNSMIYRLEKIKAATGFDLRVFNDAFCMRLLLAGEETHES